MPENIDTKQILAAISASESKTTATISAAISASESKTVAAINTAISASESKTVAAINTAISASESKNVAAISASESKTDAQFFELKSAISDYATHTDQQLTDITQRLIKVESTMVTKDYLDDKIADLRGDLVVLVRKEDTKVNKLVEILKEKDVIDAKDVKKLAAMEPFAKSL